MTPKKDRNCIAKSLENFWKFYNNTHHSYFLKASKCEFEKKNVEFLGFRVGNSTLKLTRARSEGS
jgi:hypothetical protein